jgi:predicted double-glycine peptidase
MVLAAYGLEFEEFFLRKQCQWTPTYSVLSSDVVAAAHALGFTRSREDYDLRLHDLRDAIRNGVFPIVGVDFSAYGRSGQHAQVIASVSSRGVTIQDPWQGQFVSNLFTFEEAWGAADYLTILIE